MKESLSNNISYFRNVKGLSQNELANLAKIPQSTISDIESGKRKILVLIQLLLLQRF